MSKYSIRKEKFTDEETQEISKFNVLKKEGYKLKKITEDDIGKTYRIDTTKEIWFTDEERQELLNLLK